MRDFWIVGFKTGPEESCCQDATVDLMKRDNAIHVREVLPQTVADSRGEFEKAKRHVRDTLAQNYVFENQSESTSGFKCGFDAGFDYAQSQKAEGLSEDDAAEVVEAIRDLYLYKCSCIDCKGLGEQCGSCDERDRLIAEIDRLTKGT